MNLPSAEEIQTLPPDGGNEFNRLIFESSPYLLQHARNPVDWYPWGEAAFEKAKREDKPIFLSVGYATCHWCHVMEHESFEDSAVAALMNEYFVSIKVDREERPDVDQIYMAVTQALTGHGGWPMTVVMTWDRKPFFAGTYFPKETRHGRMGMLDLVRRSARRGKTGGMKFWNRPIKLRPSCTNRSQPSRPNWTRNGQWITHSPCCRSSSTPSMADSAARPNFPLPIIWFF